MSAKIVPDDAKFKELVLYIARKCERDPRFGATKLNKILFYADFVAFKLWRKPITGQTYFRLDHGPAPRRMLPIKDEMLNDGLCVLVDRKYFGWTQKVLMAIREPDMSSFSGEEVDLVERIIEDSWEFTAKEFSKLSHDFIGWDLVDDGEDIPYVTARLGVVSDERIEQVRAMKDELDQLEEEHRRAS